MNKIKYIAVHCTGTNKFAELYSIMNYWKNVLKWKSPGYHFIIDRFGNITQLTSLNNSANGVKSYNLETIHVCYIGGVNMNGKIEDTRTEEQKSALRTKISQLKNIYPSAIVQGHRDFPNVKKECPCFDAKKEY